MYNTCASRPLYVQKHIQQRRRPKENYFKNLFSVAWQAVVKTRCQPYSLLTNNSIRQIKFKHAYLHAHTHAHTQMRKPTFNSAYIHIHAHAHAHRFNSPPFTSQRTQRQVQCARVHTHTHPCT